MNLFSFIFQLRVLIEIILDIGVRGIIGTIINKHYFIIAVILSDYTVHHSMIPIT